MGLVPLDQALPLHPHDHLEEGALVREDRVAQPLHAVLGAALAPTRLDGRDLLLQAGPLNLRGRARALRRGALR